MSMNPMTVRQAGPADLIAAAWFSLGYRPTESLLVIGLEGPSRRLGRILRCDLPATAPFGATGAPSVPEVARVAMSSIAGSPASAVVALLASEHALAGTVQELVAELLAEASAADLEVLDVVAVTPTAYRSLICSDPRCCPVAGRPIGEVMSSRTAAAHVLQGDVVAETETEVVADVRPAAAGPAPTGPAPPPVAPQSRRQWWRSWTEAFERAVRSGPQHGPDPLPGFSAALGDPWLRDAVIFDLLGAAEADVNDLLAERSPAPAGTRRAAVAPVQPDRPDRPDRRDRPDLLDRPHLSDLLARAPEPDRLRAGVGVLAMAARIAGPGERAPALAVMALLAWFEGRGARARLLLQEARADDEELSLLSLVADLLRAGAAPPWVERRPRGPKSEMGWARRCL